MLSEVLLHWSTSSSPEVDYTGKSCQEDLEQNSLVRIQQRAPIKFMDGWQSVYAIDCKPVTGRLNSYPVLQNPCGVRKMVLPHPSKLMSGVRFPYPAPEFVETRIANLLQSSVLHETFRRCVPSMFRVWH